MGRHNMLLGVDLGGTKIEAIALDPQKPRVPLSRIRIDTESDGGYRHILERIQGLVDDVKGETGLQFSAVGIGTPGSLNPRTGLLRNSNTQSLNGMPIKQDLEDLLKMKVRIANDANCFALAEAAYGAGKGAKCVFGVILGTGVGGGIAIDRKILHGHQGIGGEWGHNVLEAGGRPCYCGKNGCVESILSGPALEAFYKNISGKTAALKEIAARSEMGEESATRCIQRLVNKLSDALAFVINIVDPDCIVLGGGVSNVDAIYSGLWPQLKPKIFCDEPEFVVRKNELGDSAGVFGAALLSVAD